MSFYQYADYNSLPEDQKVIWWFDEYLCHDLVLNNEFLTVLIADNAQLPPTITDEMFIRQRKTNRAVLVQRYTLYDYAWAEGYSEALFNLFSTTEFLYPPLDDSVRKEIIVNASFVVSNIPVGGEVIISFFYSEPLSFFPPLRTILQHLNRKQIIAYTVGDSVVLKVSYDYDNTSFYTKHFIRLTAKDNGRRIEVPNFALYSLVVTGACNVDAPDDYFYSNIDALPSHYLSLREYLGTIANVFPPEEYINDSLIIAKPPDTLFNGLFNKQKTRAGANLSSGVSIPYSALMDAFYFIVGIPQEFWLSFTYEEADAMFSQLLLQTALISPSTSNLRENVRVNGQGHPIDADGNLVTDPADYVFDINPDYIEEYVMGSELMIQEIHACLGAGEFAYYMDNGEARPYYMNLSRLVQTIGRAYGVSFKPDGSIISAQQRQNIPYSQNSATIPDGYARGQFADRVNDAGDEVTGIAYQNRCNVYENLDDDNPGNDILKNGDIVLCDNFLQLFESFLEDLDKGLNWQEMGSGLLPNADGTSYTTFEGLGTLLAEMAYTLSALSSNIQQTHVLALKNNAVIMEVLKGLGLPVGVGTLPLSVGGESGAGGGNTATLTFPQLSANSVSLHKRLMDVLTTISLVTGGVLKAEDSSQGGKP